MSQIDDDFVDLAQSVAPMLHRTAWVLTADHQTCEDLVQETLAKMYVVLRRRRHLDNPPAYARSVLVRLHVDSRRRKSSGEVVTDRLPDTAGAPGPDRDGALALRAALAELGAADRTVLVLRYLCDLSPAEVARDLGISQGAVRTRASRAAAKVREALGADFVTGGAGDHDE